MAARLVCFNGQAAARFAPQLQALGYQTAVLPSTSPANATWSFERKLAAWRAGLGLFPRCESSIMAQSCNATRALPEAAER